MKAGRPKIENTRQTYTMRLDRETIRKIKVLKKSGFKIGRWIDSEISKL